MSKNNTGCLLKQECYYLRNDFNPLWQATFCATSFALAFLPMQWLRLCSRHHNHSFDSIRFDTMGSDSFLGCNLSIILNDTYFQNLRNSKDYVLNYWYISLQLGVLGWTAVQFWPIIKSFFVVVDQDWFKSGFYLHIFF